MQVFFLQRHGFRAIACADKERYCFVEFYPNSPHFSSDFGETMHLEHWLKGWTKDENWELPCFSKFEAWKKEIEERLEKKPEHWNLMSQTLFIAGLSANEVVGTLSD